jgi:hypothetical protein
MARWWISASRLTGGTHARIMIETIKIVKSPQRIIFKLAFMGVLAIIEYQKIDQTHKMSLGHQSNAFLIISGGICPR